MIYEASSQPQSPAECLAHFSLNILGVLPAPIRPKYSNSSLALGTFCWSVVLIQLETCISFSLLIHSVLKRSHIAKPVPVTFTGQGRNNGLGDKAQRPGIMLGCGWRFKYSCVAISSAWHPSVVTHLTDGASDIPARACLLGCRQGCPSRLYSLITDVADPLVAPKHRSGKSQAGIR